MQIFYKKVDKIDPDLSIDEDRSACADSWRMQFAEPFASDDSIYFDEESMPIDHTATHTGELIATGIEPNSLYAFYVQTRIINHPGARNAISKVHYVKTHYGNPDPPQLRSYGQKGPDTLFVSFDPPVKSQGIITHYTVEWEAQDVQQYIEHINACNDDCECQELSLFLLFRNHVNLGVVPRDPQGNMTDSLVSVA